MRCTRCSPGCDRCWHLTTADRLCNNPTLPEDERKAIAGTGPFVLRERELSAPSRTKKPAVIGVQFMGDLFHESVPWEFQYKVYTAASNYPQNTILVLTKRPKNMVKALKDVFFHLNRNGIYEYDHIWHGLTVCNQPEADEKLPEFLKVPGKKFLSIEPMLGEVDFFSILDKIMPCNLQPSRWLAKNINSIILGGETGAGARPMHPEWVRSVRDQCAAAGVPFFFKQWGEWAIRDSSIHGGIPNNPIIRLGENGLDTRDLANCSNAGEEIYMQRVGSKKTGRHLDGRTHDDLPWVQKPVDDRDKLMSLPTMMSSYGEGT